MPVMGVSRRIGDLVTPVVAAELLDTPRASCAFKIFDPIPSILAVAGRRAECLESTHRGPSSCALLKNCATSQGR